MEQHSNGVKKCKYPWKEQVGQYSSMTIDEKEFETAAIQDPLWANVKSMKDKDPMIWEVYNSKVTELVKEKKREEEKKPYFRFYNDRAYIVLCGHHGAVSYIYNLHIWVSKHCSSEDYVLATTKAEQLYLRLDKKPIIHREIQLRESDQFHTYFKVEVRRSAKVSGGTSTKYSNKLDKCCLLQFHEEDSGVLGKKRQWMVERKFLRGNLCSDDVFVIMNEHFIYQWNGAQSNPGEKKAASAYIKQKEANSTLSFKPPVINETVNDKDHNVYSLFPTTGKKVKVKPGKQKDFDKKLYHLKNSDAKVLGTAFEDDVTICRSNLKDDSISLLDTESHLYVWIGNHVDFQERCRALCAAEVFLMEKYPEKVEGKFSQPVKKSITLVDEEIPNLSFDCAMRR